MAIDTVLRWDLSPLPTVTFRHAGLLERQGFLQLADGYQALEHQDLSQPSPGVVFFCSSSASRNCLCVMTWYL